MNIHSKIEKRIKNNYRNIFINSLNDDYIFDRNNEYKSQKYELESSEFNYYRFVIHKYNIFNIEVKVIFCKNIPYNGVPIFLSGTIDEKNSNTYGYILKENYLYKNFIFDLNIRKRIINVLDNIDTSYMNETYKKYGINSNLMERKLKLERIKEKIKENK